MPKPNKNSYTKLPSQDNLFSVGDRLTTKNIYIDGITDEQLKDLRTRVNANLEIQTFDQFINSLAPEEKDIPTVLMCTQTKLFNSVIQHEKHLSKMKKTFDIFLQKASRWSDMNRSDIEDVIIGARNSYIDLRESAKKDIDKKNARNTECVDAEQREDNLFQSHYNALMKSYYKKTRWNKFKSTFFNCDTQSYLNCQNVTVFVASSVLILGAVKTLPLFVAGLAATAILPGLAFPLIAGAILVAAYGALCADKFKRAGKKAAEDIKKEADKTAQSQLKEEKLKARVAKAEADLKPLLNACKEYDKRYDTLNTDTINTALKNITESGSEEQIDEVIREVVDEIGKQLGELENKATSGYISIWSSVDETFTALEEAYNTLKISIEEKKPSTAVNDSDDAVGLLGEPIKRTPG
jgi:hypothetical protein